MCTQFRWLGNSAGRKRISDVRNDDKFKSYKETE